MSFFGKKEVDTNQVKRAAISELAQKRIITQFGLPNGFYEVRGHIINNEDARSKNFVCRSVSENAFFILKCFLKINSLDDEMVRFVYYNGTTFRPVAESEMVQQKNLEFLLWKERLESVDDLQNCDFSVVCAIVDDEWIHCVLDPSMDSQQLDLYYAKFLADEIFAGDWIQKTGKEFFLETEFGPKKLLTYIKS